MRCRPYASDAAVGSLTMRTTSSPAMRPASLGAWRWLSLKHAGVPSGNAPRETGRVVDVGDEAVGGAEINADDARHGPPAMFRALRRCRRSPSADRPGPPATL